MYRVSGKYLQALDQPIQRRKLRGTISDISFTEEDLLKGSVSISNSCMNSSDLKLGAVFIGELKMTFLTGFPMKRGTWKDAQISFEVGLEVEPDVYEWIPAGVFWVSKADHTAAGVVITAYDGMSKLDKDTNVNVLSGKAFEILQSICKECKLELGQTAEEFNEMPNGSDVIGTYTPNSFKTFRDIVSAISQVLGGFATVDRQGKLIIRQFETDHLKAIRVGINERFSGGKWSDFETRYTGLSVVDMADETTRYYHTTPDDGSVMNLGSNPFLQLGTKSTVTRMRETILDTINDFKFVPFSVSMLGDIAYDLGDLFIFPDGIADGAQCSLMKFVFQFNKSYALTGFGEDPATASAKSKTEKDISGLKKNGTGQLDQYYIFTNTSTLKFGREPQELGLIRYTADTETFVEIWEEIKMNTKMNDGKDEFRVRLIYLLNGTQLDYSPVFTFNVDGEQTINAHYVAAASAGQLNDWKVLVQVEDGTATVNMNEGRIVLHGQGLDAGQKWNGILEVSDVIDLGFRLHAAVDLTDNARVVLPEPTGARVQDTISVGFHSDFKANFEDSVTVVLRTGVYPVITETDEMQIMTEADEPLVTEGG